MRSLHTISVMLHYSSQNSLPLHQQLTLIAWSYHDYVLNVTDSLLFLPSTKRFFCKAGTNRLFFLTEVLFVPNRSKLLNSIYDTSLMNDSTACQKTHFAFLPDTKPLKLCPPSKSTLKIPSVNFFAKSTLSSTQKPQFLNRIIAAEGYKQTTP